MIIVTEELVAEDYERLRYNPDKLVEWIKAEHLRGCRGVMSSSDRKTVIFSYPDLLLVVEDTSPKCFNILDVELAEAIRNRTDGLGELNPSSQTALDILQKLTTTQWEFRPRNSYEKDGGDGV